MLQRLMSFPLELGLQTWLHLASAVHDEVLRMSLLLSNTVKVPMMQAMQGQVIILLSQLVGRRSLHESGPHRGACRVRRAENATYKQKVSC